MKQRRLLQHAPAPAADLFDFEIVLDLVLQVLNIIARFLEVFGLRQ